MIPVLSLRFTPSRRTLSLTLAALAGGLVLGACSRQDTVAEPLRPLQVITVGAPSAAADGGLGRSYSGEVRARIDTTLGFRVGGKLVERLVDVGARVKAGQVLARLDPTDTNLSAAQADVQRALAAADATRFRDLRDKNFVSQAALDARVTTLKANEAQAALAKNQSRYTTLLADRPGVIGLVLAEPGQVVAAGQGVFRMAPDGDREIALSIPESEYRLFRVGQKAQVSLYAFPDKILRGVVREISPAADPQSRTYPLRVALPGEPLLPTGLSASVRFHALAADAGMIEIPPTALYQQGNATAVWRVGEDASVHLQPVTVHAFRDNAVVLAGGLAGGERIAAAGVNRLAEGQKVVPVDLAGRPLAAVAGK